VVPEVKQVEHVTSPVVALIARGKEADNGTVPETSGNLMVLFEIVGSVIAKIV